MAQDWSNFCEDTGSLWEYFEQTGCLDKSTGEDNDKICPQKFKETGGYTFNESHGYFGNPDYENRNTDQGEQSIDDNIPTNEEDLTEEAIECRADATGVACDVDKEDSSAVDDDGLLLRDAIEGGRFVYVPHPEDLQNGLAPGSSACVLFTTVLERGRVQAANRISAKQRRETKYMECPFLVRYELAA